MNKKLSPAEESEPLRLEQWIVLVAAFLGWMFDGMEMGLFPIALRPALIDLLGYAGQTIDKEVVDTAVGGYMGQIVAAFLLGAAGGGWLFGWLGDKLGRVKTMALSIAVYSIFTGLCAFVTEPWQLTVFRFLAALGMGGEWALGVALVMESWPAKYKPILAGTIGAAANVGFLTISIVGAGISVTPEHWRWIMVVGAAPALLALLVIFFIPESKKWKESIKAGEKVRPLHEVFSSALASKTILGILLASVAFIGTWGAVSAFLPTWVDQMAGASAPRAKGVAQIIISIGAILGCFLGPMLARQLNRRVAYMLLCLGSFITCQYLFRTFDAERFASNQQGFYLVAAIVGLLTASFYGWLPLYLSELFPTRVRATGQGIAFNSGRVFAAAGVLTSGYLIQNTFKGNYAMACATITLVYIIGMAIIWLAPETKGKQLPE